MKKFANWLIGFSGVASWVIMLITHVATAIFIFNHVKLWAFLVVLLVPVLGDVMGIFYVIKLHYWIPLIGYGITCVLFIISGLVVNRVDEFENR